MVSLILTVLAAFFNSVMDAVENENYFESIFRNFNQSFWYKRESWKSAKKVFGYKIDAWHLAKSLMILSLVLAITFGLTEENLIKANNDFVDVLLKVSICGVLWNFSFWVFYHKIFRVK